MNDYPFVCDNLSFMVGVNERQNPAYRLFLNIKTPDPVWIWRFLLCSEA